jgi:uncharacterized protein (DUF1778 family)
MAKPIKETPALHDEDARRFLDEISSPVSDQDSIDSAFKAYMSVKDNRALQL